MPARFVCPSCWCWCHEESFEKVLTLLLFPFIHQGNFKSLPVRWLCHRAVKHKLQIKGRQYPFQGLMLEGR